MVNFINLYFIPIVFTWSLSEFFKKQYVQYLDTLEFLYLQHVIWSFFFITGFIYFMINHKKAVTRAFKKYEKFPISLFSLMFVSVFFSFISSYSSIVLLRKYDVTFYLPIIRGLSSLLVLFVGYFIYKENITKMRLIGFLLIMSGLIFIN